MLVLTLSNPYIPYDNKFENNLKFLYMSMLINKKKT